MSRIRWSADDGATATEYGMLFAFIVFGLVAAMQIFAGDVSTFISAIGRTVASWADGL